jgi:hypothetical protein
MGVKQKPRKQENALAPRQCPKCYTINGPLANYCTVCGMALNPEAEATMGELKRDIKDHPEAMQMMLNTTQRDNGDGEETEFQNLFSEMLVVAFVADRLDFHC